MTIPKIELADDLSICRILNGMWQVSGGHGQINPKSAVLDMLRYHQNGFTTWDLADIYGPAESYIGEFRKQLPAKDLQQSQALTKFVPNPGPMSKSIVEYYIDQSLQKMNTDTIDLIQFHWWDYNNPSYLDALGNLAKLQDEGKIKHLGLTNFDTKRIKLMTERGFRFAKLPFPSDRNTLKTLLALNFLTTSYLRLKVSPTQNNVSENGSAIVTGVSAI
jgi:aryl-alcohol dehydrogenase-like predicted oxidoreductase